MGRRRAQTNADTLQVISAFLRVKVSRGIVQIELIGSTGAGKTTLAQRILQQCREQGISATLGEVWVLRRFGLDGISNRLVRLFFLDLIALAACLVTVRGNWQFFVFSVRTILPLSLRRFEKLNIFRNVFKKVGIYEIIRRFDSDQAIVIVDEGTLHAAHNLFVHVSAKTKDADLATFAKIVPLPDLVIHVTQSKAILIERTISRRHKRIPKNSYSDVEHFINCAVQTFENLIQQLVLEKRMYMADSTGMILVKEIPLSHPLFDQFCRVTFSEFVAVPTYDQSNERFNPNSQVSSVHCA